MPPSYQKAVILVSVSADFCTTRQMLLPRRLLGKKTILLLFFLVCTSHGVQELGDLVDTLPVSGWRKLGWKAKFTRSRQSGCRERSVGWVSCHLLCLASFHFVFTLRRTTSTFIHLLSSVDADCRPSVSILLYVPHHSESFFFPPFGNYMWPCWE